MNHPAESPLDGILNLYKPCGRSSARYVYRLRPILGVRKVGHAGTLDPFADGVLVACIGRGTKLVERIMSLPKHYRTTMRLGVTNETFDTERPFDPVPDAVEPSREDIERVLAGMLGEKEQIAPLFSAVKHRGQPSYHWVRQGKVVPRTSRCVRIDRLDVCDYAWPNLTLEIGCGRGTYIRAIARDLGQTLGCGACCETLTRTAVGPFKTEDAVNLDESENEVARARFIDLAEAERMLAAPGD